MKCTVLGHVDGQTHRLALVRIIELEAALIEIRAHVEATRTRGDAAFGLGQIDKLCRDVMKDVSR